MQQPTPPDNWTPRADPTPHPAPARRSLAVRIASRWYYVVVVGTAGAFAWVPFLHAAIRLRTRKARALALIFGGIDALIYTLLAIEPNEGPGQAVSSAGATISTILGLLMLGTVIVGCVMVAPLRRLAYDGDPADTNVRAEPTVDLAIKAALAARARRDGARKLAADDPLLATELHIGRPDLTGDYDDGGLVDLNSAPADVIAEVCGIPAAVAATIVEFRAEREQPFANADELFVMADLPVSTWDRIRDRGVLLS
jgi:DNA uptake protein ComE-like DNA-binding protein